MDIGLDGERSSGSRIKLARFREQLSLGQMMLVDDLCSDNSLREFRVVGFCPRDELVHFVTHAGAGAEDEDVAEFVQGIGHRFEVAGRFRLFLALLQIHGVSRVAKIAIGLMRENPVRSGTWNFGAEDPRLMMIDHEQPVSVFIAILGHGGLGPLQKMTKPNNLVDLSDVLGEWWMQDDVLSVAPYLQVSVGFFIDRAKVTEQGVNILPFEVVRNRVLENSVVGPQMGTSE